MKRILMLLILIFIISGCHSEEIKGSTAMLSGKIEIEDLKVYKQELLNKENEIKDKEENKQENKEETNEDKIVQYYVDKKVVRNAKN